MKKFIEDVTLALMFLKALRYVRKEMPDKSVYCRVDETCEIMRMTSVQARLLHAIKHGGTK